MVQKRSRNRGRNRNLQKVGTETGTVINSYGSETLDFTTFKINMFHPHCIPDSQGNNSMEIFLLKPICAQGNEIICIICTEFYFAHLYIIQRQHEQTELIKILFGLVCKCMYLRWSQGRKPCRDAGHPRSSGACTADGSSCTSSYGWSRFRQPFSYLENNTT